MLDLDGPCERRPESQVAPREQHDRCRAHRSGAPAGLRPARGEARPHEAPGEALLIEPGGLVLADARGQDLGLPGARWRLEALELREDRAHRIGTLHAKRGRDALPVEEEAHEVARLGGLDLYAQPLDGVVMAARERPPFAPLTRRGRRVRE